MRMRYKMIVSKTFYLKIVPTTGLAFMLCPYLSLFLFLSGSKVYIYLIPLIVEESILISIILGNIINLLREDYWFISWNRDTLGLQIEHLVFHICLLVYLCKIRILIFHKAQNPLVALLSLYCLNLFLFKQDYYFLKGIAALSFIVPMWN